MKQFSPHKCATFRARLIDPAGIWNSFHMSHQAHDTNYPDAQLVGYARVSTSEQSLDMQLEALKKYGVPEDKIWHEKKSAGAKDRPQLRYCMKFLEPGDTLVVWKLDRLGRSMIDLLKQIEKLNEMGVNFVSLTEQIETVTPGGKLLFHVLAGLAQFERDLIRQRTTAGMEAKMATGWKPGPPRLLNPDQEKQVVAWRKKGWTAKQIVEEVRIEWGIKVSQRTIKNTYDRLRADRN